MSESICLGRKILSYEAQLQYIGCDDVALPGPDLRNPIHPIFRLERWMKGYSQDTHKFYDAMKMALRLASRLITEDSTLPWFHCLVHGQRRTCRRSGSGANVTYLETSWEAHTTRGQNHTKRELLELADVIVFMWTPAGYKQAYGGDCWGMTCRRRIDCDGIHEYTPSDYPPLPNNHRPRERNGYFSPLISLNREFRQTFGGRHPMTQSQQYRAAYMFAATLVHELAHAFWMWGGR